VLHLSVEHSLSYNKRIFKFGDGCVTLSSIVGLWAKEKSELKINEINTTVLNIIVGFMD
jgi:hypothetical protein